jgi:hypothetical protein
MNNKRVKKMAVNKELYFIPLIAQAFNILDEPSAMTKAVEEIVNLGKKDEYKEGYRQFEQFVDAGLDVLLSDPKRSRQVREEVVAKILVALATDTFEGKDEVIATILETIRGNPDLSARYEKLRTEIRPFLQEETPFEFEIEKNCENAGSIIIEKKQREGTLEGVEPGNYRISLASGRLLWEGEITEDDVLWTRAFPGEKLDLAADTEGKKTGITKTETLLDGELILSFSAGLESGQITISLNR